MTMGELSAADVAAVTRPNLMGYGMGGFGNGFGYGGDWILGLIAIAAIFGGGFGGFGFGGGGAGAAGLGLQAGFDTQNILRNQDSIKNGLCDGFYAMNTNNLQAQNQLQRDLCNGFAAVNAAINASAAADQKCCCETQRQIDNVRYDLTTTDNTNTQKILDKLCNMELSAKDQKIADLMAANQSKDLVISQFNQNNYLANRLDPRPVPAYHVQNPNCCQNPCGFGYYAD